MWNYNLGQTFRNLAERHADRPALKFAGHDYTYAELNARSDVLASALRQRGLRSTDVMMLTSQKSFDTFALVVAAWKLGVTHCFVDRFSPKERLEKIVRTCAPKLIITDTELRSRLARKELSLAWDLDAINGVGGDSSDEVRQWTDEVCSNTLAYIMFTSGSTGTPKGVAITHEQVLRFAAWGRTQYALTSEENITGLNSLFFDNSVFDLTMSLLQGASLVPVSREEFNNTSELLQHLEAKGATTWFSVPSLLVYFLNLHAFENGSLPSLKRFVFGGEGFPKGKLEELFELFGARVELHNVYGPTEGTCICSSYQISPTDFKAENRKTLAPLGQIAANFKMQILDQNNEPTPFGEVGELWLGGSNVSVGYYNEPVQSQLKFVQNPRHQAYRDIFYRTGDLVRLHTKDQLLYFCGRQDDQIKFMGYRIELSEIEAALASLAGVQEVAVTFGTKDAAPEITCFLKGTATKSFLREALTEVIPSYMVPRKFINLPQLPKNANGKIDKKKLASEHYDQTPTS